MRNRFYTLTAPIYILQMKHKLLIDQVKKHLDGLKKIHPQLESFINDVNCSYQQFDGDYFVLEHTTKFHRKGFSPPLKDCTNDRLTREQGLSAYLQEDCIAAVYYYKSNWAKVANSTSLDLRISLMLLKF